MSDNKLGAFLRTRREAVTPAEVGLPEGPRRRTPGLRRSELALLAGISVEYLARLEQGRDNHPSPQVLGALCDALRMPLDDRLHLRQLLKGDEDHFLCAVRPLPQRDVRPTVRALLNRLEPTPAVVVNYLGEIAAYTDGYERLVGPLGLLDAEVPSLPRYILSDPRAKEAYPDWERAADEQVEFMRFALTRQDPVTMELAQELTITVGKAFTDRLATPTRLARRSGTETLRHPEAGELRLSYEVLELPEADGQRMLVHLPADEATARALDLLDGRRPGSLRAVGG
ncbi:helix-turn-helix domain-containing protein [Streptomyces sp. TRM66268-LWL]|uniref:Helix-turn-helix domain-containing protein n=1 Tax=Streptomyces polyasparticus TaxID=2767826 RepID=A0ABR7SGF5_9ACTN|nr:helix-turn-helix domain-containing protein [Streptomyces polyasparticus]MBC9713830.1 helix-turn-helix domain-containing protein [Streptomyces polyasparticus]